jgi:hypothetical protein
VSGVCERAGERDAGSMDAARADTDVDTGPIDTGPLDTGPIDTGPIDTGPLDTGPIDTGVFDTGAFDTGRLELDAAMDLDAVDLDMGLDAFLASSICDVAPAPAGRLFCTGFEPTDTMTSMLTMDSGTSTSAAMPAFGLQRGDVLWSGSGTYETHKYTYWSHQTTLGASAYFRFLDVSSVDPVEFLRFSEYLPDGSPYFKRASLSLEPDGRLQVGVGIPTMGARFGHTTTPVLTDRASWHCVSFLVEPGTTAASITVVVDGSPQSIVWDPPEAPFDTGTGYDNVQLGFNYDMHGGELAIDDIQIGTALMPCR